MATEQTDEATPNNFDFKRHLIKVQGGRTYLPVSARLVWFRTEHPDWGIETEAVEINHEKQFAIFRATIYDAAGRKMATGTKQEDVKGFGDWIEKAETGSVGRALALCGYGTQFAPDLDEGAGQNQNHSQSRPQGHPAARPAREFTGQAQSSSHSSQSGQSLACEICGASLTTGQQTISVRKYNRVLCLTHQKETTPQPGPAAAAYN